VNRELKRVSGVVLLMFLALFVSTTAIQVFQADNLRQDDRNRRALLESYSTERGQILVDGQAIAQSQPADDQYKFQRTYAAGDLYSAVTGYFTLGQGSSGLEDALNNELSGTANTQFLDGINRLITGQDPKGASVELTIDPAAQQAAFDALGNNSGAVVAIAPKTGAILAMVSKRSYDPNLLAVHDPDQVLSAYRSLESDPAEPLQNRAIAGDLNPPGSVFKLVVTAAALESGDYTPDSTFPNPPTFTLPGTESVVTNSGEGACGSQETVTLSDALRLSCNIPFSELGIAMGDGTIRDMAEQFGFNQSVDVPMASTPSVYPTDDLGDAETALTAFGQQNVRATPLQIAMVSAGIANGGDVMRPTLVESVLAPDLREIRGLDPSVFGSPIGEDTAATLTQLMVNNVENGVASNARIGGVSVAGKTGTAENGTGEPYSLWFTGFAPADDPEVAVAVVVENGGGQGQSGRGNTLAAPIAKRVLEAVLNK
jgi:peptidoglycan glycosyltransferase